METVLPQKWRVVIIDDSRTMQAMLETAFGNRRDFRVIGVASDATAGAEMVKRLMPDLVTIDLCMPYIDGAALLNMLADTPAVCKVIVSDQCEKSILMRSQLEALGASACVGKRELAENSAVFFKKMDAACHAQQAARKRSFVPHTAVDPRPTSIGHAPPPDPSFGFPIPLDERARLTFLRTRQLGNAVRERQFDLITDYVAALTAFPVCLLTFITIDTQWIKSAYGLEQTSMPREQAFCNYTISQGTSFVVPNAANDERFAGNPLVTGPLHVRAYAGMPIVAHDGTRIGALCLIDTKPRTVSTMTLRHLAAMADLLGEMIDQRPLPAAA